MIRNIKKISQVTQEVTFFLKKINLSNDSIIKIYDMYGDATIQLVKDDPYFLLKDFPRLGFKKVDEISLQLGNSLDNEYRTQAGINYLLASHISMGDTYVEMDTLVNEVAQYLEIQEKKVSDMISDMAFNSELQVANILDTKVVYFTSFYKAEIDIAKKLKMLNESIVFKVIGNYKERINQFEANGKIHLSENQKLAILSSVGSPISIITGGPGTGKTTVINVIVDIFEASGMKVALTAPTGRASKRITETTKHYSETIHRLLGYYFDEADHRMKFSKNENNMLDYNAIIVDESSMIDLMLMDSLLKAVKSGTRLIFVGDKDQLPSVGAGNVLSDLIESDCFTLTKLNRIYRQDIDSEIINSAHKINGGQYPFLEEVKENIVPSSDLVMYREESYNDIQKRIVEVAGFYDSNDVQVLSPIKKQKVGTIELNEKLREIFNPRSDKKDELPYGKRSFRVGDRVMQNKNNYGLEYISFKRNVAELKSMELIPFDNIKDDVNVKTGQGVFNGEIGIVTAIDKEEKSLVVLFDDERYVKYEHVDLDEIEHAYAITIHKSQGSEFPICIIPMTYFPGNLGTRSLIYTGITRGKDKVIIVGNPDYLNAMVDNDSSGNRKSGLIERITDTFMGLS